MSRKLSTGDRRPAWMNIELLTKVKHKKYTRGGNRVT